MEGCQTRICSLAYHPQSNKALIDVDSLFPPFTHDIPLHCVLTHTHKGWFYSNKNRKQKQNQTWWWVFEGLCHFTLQYLFWANKQEDTLSVCNIRRQRLHGLFSQCYCRKSLSWIWKWSVISGYASKMSVWFLFWVLVFLSQNFLSLPFLPNFNLFLHPG